MSIQDWTITTAQKMKFSVKGFFSKFDQIRRKLCEPWKLLQEEWVKSTFVRLFTITPPTSKKKKNLLEPLIFIFSLFSIEEIDK